MFSILDGNKYTLCAWCVPTCECVFVWYAYMRVCAYVYVFVRVCVRGWERASVCVFVCVCVCVKKLTKFTNNNHFMTK